MSLHSSDLVIVERIKVLSYFVLSNPLVSPEVLIRNDGFHVEVEVVCVFANLIQSVLGPWDMERKVFDVLLKDFAIYDEVLANWVEKFDGSLLLEIVLESKISFLNFFLFLGKKRGLVSIHFDLSIHSFCKFCWF